MQVISIIFSYRFLIELWSEIVRETVLITKNKWRIV